jgi:PAS domain S-box-containing protein
MVLDGKPVGLLGIANKPGGFTENDARMASTFGELAAIALQNKRAEEELLRAHNKLEMRVVERTAELEKANEALRRSEASLSKAQQVAHIGNWDWNIQTNQLHWSDEIYRIFGLSPQEFGATYDAFLDSVHPGDREFVIKAVNEALYEKKSYRIDHRIVLPDGRIRIVHEQAEITFDEAGMPVQMLGTVQDITDLKKAEEELKKSYEQLRNLSAHLRSVREEERTNIAREIHDELGQALTALKIDISMLATKLYPDHKPLVEKTESMIKRIDETIQTVKKICTELRPTVLDHFGLSAAIEWQAEDFQKRTGINCKVSLHHEDIMLDQNISIVIFRIFQEALTNVMRHADATEVKASLKAKDGMITLEVIDNGKGITEEKITNSNSFGLLGIRERVNFLGGNVTISGMRNKGTAIRVNIPFQKKGEGQNENSHR